MLTGITPADLPGEPPTKVELPAHLQTARALRLTLSESLLTRTDEVIE